MKRRRTDKADKAVRAGKAGKACGTVTAGKARGTVTAGKACGTVTAGKARGTVTVSEACKTGKAGRESKMVKTGLELRGPGAYVALCLCTVFFCWLFCLRHGMFGGKVDWISQHSVLPDYFRRQFYATGELFPEFAANIGGGQNIYHFSYYGLLSPVVLLSYLFPFIKMPDYLMGAQMVSLVSSVLLLYRWLSGQGNGFGGKGFDRKVCFLTAVIFLLAGPMVFHSYNQIMFVNYMPFLCMGFLGVDRYFEADRGETEENPGTGRRRGGVLSASVFLMIMTSFYFSIGGMLALGIYGIHRYVGIVEDQRAVSDEEGDPGGRRNAVLTFLKEGVWFLFPFFTAVLMSGVLLIPTAMAMAGREGGSHKAALSSLLLPEFSPVRFFYSPYGMGLTTLVFTALLGMLFFRKWSERALALGCLLVLTVPFFVYLLNGGLYVRDKVMIPFLPLMCYVIACYVSGLGEMGEEAVGAMAGKAVGQPAKEAVEGMAQEAVGRVDREAVEGMAQETVGKPAGEAVEGMAQEAAGEIRGITLRESAVNFLPYIATLCVLCVHFAGAGAGRYGKLMLADGAVMLLCYGIFRLRKNVLILLIPPVIFLAFFGNGYHREGEKYLDREFYGKVTDERLESLIKTAAGSEDGLYRTEQYGTAEENAANLNRVWDMGQYVSSVYSSLYNREYQKFRRDFGAGEPYRNFLMQPVSENPVFQRFMGVKYLVADKKFPGRFPGYGVTAAEGDRALYENPSASPVAYATDKVMGEEAYESLEFPENQLSLLEYAVAEKAGTDGDSGSARNADSPGNAVRPGSAENSGSDKKSRSAENIGSAANLGSAGNAKNINHAESAKSYIPVNIRLPEEISSKEKETAVIDIPRQADELKDQPGIRESSPQRVLFLRFRVENLKPSKDVTIWAEGQRNKLTAKKHFYYNENTRFTYALPLQEGQSQAELVFGEGHYRIADVQCFLGVLPSENEAESLYQSLFLPDREKTGGNVIAGSIRVKNAGYFITTIPCDDGFTVFVDGKKAETERVNTAFLGCRIDKGRHQVEIVYHAPGMAAGKMASVIGFFLFLGMHAGRRRIRQKNHKIS